MRAIKVIVALLVSMVVMLMPTQASAATQEDFYHFKNSQRANMLAFSNWDCTGRGFEFIRKGERNQEIDVRSVWIPKGYSFWSFNSKGEGVQVARHKSKARCFSFRHYPGNHFIGAFAKGKTFKPGD